MFGFMNFLRVRYLIVLVFWSGTVYGGSVDHWLTKIHDAAGLNYQGVFVYAYESILETMSVTHRAESGVITERIYSLNGVPREIIRDAEQVWCYAPGQKPGAQEIQNVTRQNVTRQNVTRQIFPNLLPRGLTQLGNNYDLSLGRQGRIADRSAQQILILPLDEYRYGYVLWADQKTGLLLKAALITRDKESIEQYMFTEIKIGGPIDVADLSPKTARNDLQWLAGKDDAQKPRYTALKNPTWEVGNIPKGFMILQQIKGMSPLRNRMMEHYVYSDGLAAVSVFIEMIDNGDAWTQMDGANRIGAVQAFSRTQDGYHITVVGEVPSKTVDMIGMSVSKILQ